MIKKRKARANVPFDIGFYETPSLREEERIHEIHQGRIGVQTCCAGTRRGTGAEADPDGTAEKTGVSEPRP